ncbi:MAG: proprotein convertase P-domain-containing protein, partial [Bacteroidota bacterium]
VKDLKVMTNITHSYIGDLVLKLSAPSGKEVTLSSREGGAEDGQGNVFSGDIVAALIGEQAMGNWTLTATDSSSNDGGTLDSWSIEIDCEEYNNHKAEIFIPEIGSEKVLTSQQNCRFEGRVLDAIVDVEIEHPLIGDLIVSLVAPSGTEVVLHNRTGGSQNHLKAQYGSENLQAIMGERTAGIWTLKVQNMHASNNGVLKHWKIKFHYEPEDDLKVVEGIGPKIEELIKNAGIYSYVSLATTAPERIEEILAAGGDRFKMHDPGTWPAQSSLAAQGRWEELNALKEELDGGK